MAPESDIENPQKRRRGRNVFCFGLERGEPVSHTAIIEHAFPKVNNKRVRRLWRDEGLKVPQTKRKKRLTGVGVHVGLMCPIRPDALWALDFQFDHTIDGRQVKLLNIIDEYTRECLSISVAHSIDAVARSTGGSETNC